MGRLGEKKNQSKDVCFGGRVVLKRFFIVQNKGGLGEAGEGVGSEGGRAGGIKLRIISCLNYYNNSHCIMAKIIQLNSTAFMQEGLPRPRLGERGAAGKNLPTTIEKCLEEYSRSSIVVQQCFQQQIHIFHLTTPLFQNFTAITSIEINVQSTTAYITTKLAHAELLTFLHSLDQFKYLCAKLLTLNLISLRQHLKITIEQATGLLSWKRRLNLSPSPVSAHLLFSIIKKQMGESIKFGKLNAANLAYLTNKITPSSYLNMLSEHRKELWRRQKDKLAEFTRLKELIPFLTTDLKNKKLQTCRSNKNFSQIDLKKSSTILEEVYAAHSQLQQKNRLFWFNNYEERVRPHNFQISQENILNQLVYPTYTELKKEKTTIFNEVVVLEQKDKERFLTEGGKARVSMFNLKMKYVQNPDNTKEAAAPKSRKETPHSLSQITIDKSLLGKIPKKLIEGSKMDCVRYQRQILTHLKDSNCAYFPKYYFTSQTNYVFSDFFLMDFIQKHNLNIQSQIKYLSLSLKSKLLLLVHLSNAIRFLETKGIVHIDLSPNNILVEEGFMVKLIDFGESYHPETSRKYGASKNKKDFRYNPGKTVPFTAPEVYSRTDDFSSQQDIFSLGVIAFKLIFGSYPFRCSDKMTEKSFKEKNYMDCVFLAPENAEDLGNVNLYNILMMVVTRLLSVREQSRPTPSWIHLMFKKIAEISHV